MPDEFRSARYQSLSKILRRSALRHGDKTAIICGNVLWSYARFDTIVDALAHGLTARGIVPGVRVAILARNGHAFLAIRFALARLGAVLVPINFMLTAPEVRYILDHSGARMLFVDATTLDIGCQAAVDLVEVIYGLPGELTPAPHNKHAQIWDDLLVEAEPFPDQADADTLLQIIYTSGTESRPKGVMLTHGAVLWEYQSCIIDCEWTADAVALHALPLFHCAQLDCMIGPALSVGACNIITAEPSADNLLTLLERHSISSFFCPPTIWIALLRAQRFEPAKLQALIKGYYGASIMPVAVLEELQQRLPQLRLWNLYGQTEIAPLATILFPEEHARHLGSAGRATLNVETRVVDDAMRDVLPGEIGEIVHRSPQLCLGYWREEALTRQAFSGGWFHSGDLAQIDPDGYITVVDRKKDMIKTGGENVSSREIEEVLYKHPAVAEVAVIGLPHDKWIEQVTAIVVCRSGAEALSADDLKAHCAQHIAGFKCPKHIIFAEDLPRNASGKVLKRDLRERYQADVSPR